jgi:hypothetical protein
MRNKIIPLFIVLETSFMIIYISYIVKRSELLWIGIFMAFIPIVLSISNNKHTIEKLIFILLFTLLIRWIPAYYSYSWPFLPGFDTAYEGDTTNLLLNKGHWQPGMGNNPTTQGYSLYPIKYIFTSILIQVVDTDLILVSRWIMPAVTHIITMLFIYHIFKYLISKESAIWATFFYGISPGYVTYNYQFTREQIALVFFTMSLYIIAKWNTDKIKSSILIFSMLTIVLTMTHHWTSYNFVWFLIVFYLFSHISKWFGLKPSKSIIVITLISFFLWHAYIAYIMFYLHIKLIQSIFIQSISPVAKPIEYMRGYAEIHRLLIYLGQAFILLFSSFGFLSLRKGNAKSSFIKMLYILSIISLIMLTFVLPKLIGRGEEFATIEKRNWTFNYIGIAVLAGQFFSNLSFMNNYLFNTQRFLSKIKKILLISCLFPIISSILLYYPPYWDFSSHDPNTMNLYKLSLYLSDKHFYYPILTVQALRPLLEINGIVVMEINEFSKLEEMNLSTEGVVVDRYIMSIRILQYLSATYNIIYDNGVNVLIINR